MDDANIFENTFVDFNSISFKLIQVEESWKVKFKVLPAFINLFKYFIRFS